MRMHEAPLRLRSNKKYRAIAGMGAVPPSCVHLVRRKAGGQVISVVGLGMFQKQNCDTFENSDRVDIMQIQKSMKNGVGVGNRPRSGLSIMDSLHVRSYQGQNDRQLLKP